MVLVLNERSKKIAKWPRSANAHNVRCSLDAIGKTKRWIKNFAELARPLHRLIGKHPWKWEEPEQLSFDLLRLKVTRTVTCYGFDWKRVAHFYTDA